MSKGVLFDSCRYKQNPQIQPLNTTEQAKRLPAVSQIMPQLTNAVCRD
jgi:hypothetical protein